MNARPFWAAALAALLAAPAVAKTPCDDLRLNLPAAQQAAWAGAVAKQLNVSSVDLLAVFGSRDWRILYVDTHETDEVLLFYPKESAKGLYLNLWSGAAASAETAAIESWALQNVQDIPKQLASCFAWYATTGR